MILPNLYAQYSIWKQNLLPECKRSDVVISTGNLIALNEAIEEEDKKRANEVTVASVLAYANYERWVQLLGPNEAIALNNPTEWTTVSTVRTIREAWYDKKIWKVSAVMYDQLVTQGGLTYGEWIDLDRPQTAREASDRLNEKYECVNYFGPCYWLNNRPNFAANPIFADPYYEFYNSWIMAPEDCPFDQVHTSGSLSTFLGRQALDPHNLSPISMVTSVQYKRYGTETYIGRQRIIGSDFYLQGPISDKGYSRSRKIYTQSVPLNEVDLYDSDGKVSYDQLQYLQES